MLRSDVDDELTFVRESLAGHLPAGHRLLDLYDVWLGEAALPGRVAAGELLVDPLR